MNALSLFQYFMLSILIYAVESSSELTFMLEAKDEMCFYEHAKQGEQVVLEFQVIKGGNLDVDLTLKSPRGKISYQRYSGLHRNTLVPYDSLTSETAEEGIYEWCFSNKIFLTTSKLIYFKFQVGFEQLQIPFSSGAISMLEMSAGSIHESLNVIADYQMQLKFKEIGGRAYAEELNERIMWWSSMELICILTVMIVQFKFRMSREEVQFAAISRVVQYRCLILSILIYAVNCSSELTFMLEAKDEMCFYEHVKQGEETVIEFQVIEGGNLDVDLTLKSPGGKILYQDTQKQYDSHTWKTTEEGIYEWCFSNKFSTFTSKLIYFDFMAGDEEPQIPVQTGAGAGIAMTSLEMSAGSIHESLNVIADYQKHFRLKEMGGRAFAEDVNERVMWWSVMEFVCILTIMIGQVFTVRSFFSDKKNKKTTAST